MKPCCNKIIDIVAVVRRKNCRYWQSRECTSAKLKGGLDFSLHTEPDDYCSYGVVGDGR